MGDAIRIGIVGYGNLGRGVELAIARNPDMALTGVFTRRLPGQVATVSADTPVYGIEALDARKQGSEWSRLNQKRSPGKQRTLGTSSTLTPRCFPGSGCTAGTCVFSWGAVIVWAAW